MEAFNTLWLIKLWFTGITRAHTDPHTHTYVLLNIPYWHK